MLKIGAKSGQLGRWFFPWNRNCIVKVNLYDSMTTLLESLEGIDRDNLSQKGIVTLRLRDLLALFISHI